MTWVILQLQDEPDFLYLARHDGEVPKAYLSLLAALSSDPYTISTLDHICLQIDRPSLAMKFEE